MRIDASPAVGLQIWSLNWELPSEGDVRHPWCCRFRRSFTRWASGSQCGIWYCRPWHPASSTAVILRHRRDYSSLDNVVPYWQNSGGGVLWRKVFCLSFELWRPARVPSWDLCFSFSTEQMSSALGVWEWKYIVMRTIHSCTSVVLKRTRRQQLQEWSSASTKSVHGCHQTAWNWMETRPSLFGWVHANGYQRSVKMPLIIQGAELSPLHSVRDLGFIIDSKLTMSDHVNNVVRSCFFQLRQLRSVRHSLPIEARKALVHCFISSRIDYCNAILYGVSGAVLRCLQTVLNAAARLIVDAGKRQHMTPILRDLHWLPVKERILYKIGILSFQCVRRTGPAYLVEMFTRVSDVEGRSTPRSAARGDFVIPRSNTVTFGPRSFRVSGPTFWNKLPLEMRDQDISYEQFKSKLKTLLFEQAYRALL